MEVRPGYKRTEVGVIPEDWESAPVGEVTDIRVGRDLLKDRFSAERDSTYPFPVYSNTVANEGLYGFYSIPEYEGDSVTVVGRGVGLGTAFARSGGYGAIGRLLVLLPYRRIDARFLATYINQRVSIFIETGGIPQLTGIQFSKYKVALPLVLEQRAIAEALSDVDGLLGGLDRLIAKKRDLKQAAMQRLLTGQTRLPGFHGVWEVKGLAESCELITKGTTPTSVGRNFTESGVNFLKAESISESGSPISEKVAFIDTATHKLLRRSQLREGDLLISIAGVLGRVGRVSKSILPANTNQALAIVRLGRSSALDRSFLFFYLRSPMTMKQIADVNVQAAQANISLQNVRDLEIHVPPSIPEQTAIAEVLTEMDAELAALEQRREKTRALKQAMMQELLTGRTRLV